MIEGVVTDGEAIVALSVKGPADAEHRIEVVIDTGFDRFLTLPPDLIEKLGLIPRGDAEAILADGSITSVPIYRATVVWDGRLRPVVIEQANTTPLVGMLLLDGYELHMQCTEGGSVTVSALRRSADVAQMQHESRPMMHFCNMAGGIARRQAGATARAQCRSPASCDRGSCG